MSNVWIRVCYKGGIAKEENKIYELHKVCDCSRCSSRWGDRTRRNEARAYAAKESEIEQVGKLLSKWTCADKDKDLPVEYLNNCRDI